MSIPLFPLCSACHGGASIPIKRMNENGMLHYMFLAGCGFSDDLLLTINVAENAGANVPMVLGSSAITDLTGRCLLHYCRRQGWLSALRLISCSRVLAVSTVNKSLGFVSHWYDRNIYCRGNACFAAVTIL